MLERSTGRALEHAAATVAGVMEDSDLSFEGAIQTLEKALNGRHGFPLIELLRKEVLRGAKDRKQVIGVLRHFGEVCEPSRRTTSEEAARKLAEVVAGGRRLLLTTGYSEAVARVLRELAQHDVTFSVILVRADVSSDGKDDLVTEQRLMKQELYLSPKLVGRVTRTSFTRLEQAKLPLSREGSVIVGAGAVSTQGELVQPRGGRKLYEDVCRLVMPSQKAPQLALHRARIAVCEGFKIFEPRGIERAWRERLLTSFKLGEDYDSLLTDGREIRSLPAGQPNVLEELRTGWLATLERKLSSVESSDQSRASAPSD